MATLKDIDKTYYELTCSECGEFIKYSPAGWVIMADDLFCEECEECWGKLNTNFKEVKLEDLTLGKLIKDERIFKHILKTHEILGFKYGR